MISMIDRPELTSQRRWIHDLWAGLKLLAESGLTDFQPLHAAKRALATQEQAAWEALIGDLGPVLVDVTGHTLGIEVCDGMSFAGPHLTFSPIIHRNSPLPARYESAYSKLYDDQKVAEIHVLQGEWAEVHRNRSIGKFLLNLESGGGSRSKIVVRFDLTLDGTLKATATQPATGLSQELRIDNALSQFKADERDRAEARLGSMFDASDEFFDEEELPSPTSWARLTVEDSSRVDDAAFAESKFAEAILLLKKAEALKASVEAEDARDIESLCESLKQGIAAHDLAAVASLSEELDDILFYVG